MSQQMSESSARIEAMKQRNKSVWDDMASGWYAQRDDIWGFSRPVGEWMVRKLDPRQGDIILELAAGLGETGYLAAPLVGQTGRVICTDFAPEMVTAARRRAEEMGIRNIEFKVLDAERMDLESDSVDGVLCRWGYMLMPDPAAAFTESRRVLRPGRRLAFSVWAGPERNPWVSLLIQTLVSEGHIPPPEPTAPGIFALADVERIWKLVTGAGFTDPEIEEMSLAWSFRDRDVYWNFLTDAAGAVSPLLRALPPDVQTTVRNHMEQAAEPFRSGNGYSFPATVLNVVTY